MLKKKSRLLVYVLMCGFLVVTVGMPAWASAFLSEKDDPCTPAADQMLLFYDPATHQETILFSPAYRFRADFGIWMVPFPAEAKVDRSGAQFFQRLEDYVNPPPQKQIRYHWRVGSLLWELVKKLFTKQPALDPGSLEAPPQGKAYIARRSAGLRIVPIASESPEKFEESIKTALGKPDFQIPKNFSEWAKPYQDQKYSWIGLAVNTDHTDPNPKIDEQVKFPPFKVTFTTDKLYVPMTFPAFESPAGWRTNHSFQYFIATSERSEVMVGDRPFFAPNEIMFADRISKDDWFKKILSTSLPELPITGDVFVTAFERSEPKKSPVGQDGSVVPARVQNTLHPSPKIFFEDKFNVVPVEAILLILGGGVLWYRDRKKR